MRRPPSQHRQSAASDAGSAPNAPLPPPPHRETYCSTGPPKSTFWCAQEVLFGVPGGPKLPDEVEEVWERCQRHCQRAGAVGVLLLVLWRATKKVSSVEVWSAVQTEFLEIAHSEAWP
eukprot:13830445-Alexandrium_andersonii.AAC.1